ncbi:MAG TPA: UDP-N-acetylmuramate--L-alanine ligase, partial [Spirochaetota bacterium]|nr:UDP-N-acetylmuramate--L-alanine ligase [Spirochaetota bacterium]HOM11583.1 UDP-N-acetylmuramate--L-alanine ligase [Spirochaetota bacterium]
EGVSSQLIQQAVKKHEGRDVEIIQHLDDVPEYVCRIARKGDVILTLGAGDIYKVGPKILSVIEGKGIR